MKSQLEHDGQLLFSVSDTGPGLPAENIDQDLFCLLHHQVERQWDGVGHQPFHCGVARRPVVGYCQRRTRCNVLFHLADPRDGVSIGDLGVLVDLDHETGHHISRRFPLSVL